MDPLSSLLDSINQAASSRSPSAQDVLAHASTIIAPSEQVASQRTTTAPSELAAPESAMSAPAGNGATDIVDTEVGGDDSPLSSASPEVVRLPRWDDLGWSYSLNCNLLHKLILSFSFKGTVIKPSSSSSSFRACRVRLRRAAWGIEGRWGISQPGHRHEILSDRFPDLGESSYEDWRSWTSAFSPGRRRRTFRDFSLRWDPFHGLAAHGTCWQRRPSTSWASWSSRTSWIRMPRKLLRVLIKRQIVTKKN